MDCRIILVALLALGLASECFAHHSSGDPLHHTTDGFQNPFGSPERRIQWGDRIRLTVRRFLFSPGNPEIPTGHVLSAKDRKLQWQAAQGKDSITWLGHSTFLIQLQDKIILTDPFLTEYASPVPPFGPKRFVPSPWLPETLPRVDVLIVSHNHYDHLDNVTLRRLPGKGHIRVIVPLGLKPIFAERGYQNIQELDWFEHVELDGLTVTLLPAIHYSRRGIFSYNKTLWGSYALKTIDRKIFFSGDTEFGPVFEEIGKRQGPFDLALIGIGSYLPVSLMDGIHTNPEEAVDLAKAINARQIVGMHWGTIQMSEERPFEPPRRFQAAAEKAGFSPSDAWVLSIGETRVLRP